MAADPLAIRPYYAVMSLGFTTKQTLAALMIAAYNALSIAVPNLAASEIEIYALDTNGQPVLIGDENITTSNYAYALPGGAARRYGPYPKSPVPIDNIYVMSGDGSTSVQLGIEVIPV